MGLKTFNPVTPGLRQLVIVDRQGLHNGPPEKALTVGKNSTGGRNNLGRITVRFRGGGHKRSYRLIDFKRRIHSGKKGIVQRFEYDPNRSAFVALVEYEDGARSYILAPQRLAVGDAISSGNSVDIKPGCSMPIGNIPIGTIVHNVEFKVGKGGGLARSAGAYAQIVGRDRGKVVIRLSSGEQRFINGMCFATVGVLSNPDHMNRNDGKAGRTRWRGRRPHNRGVSMNPIDHPHGGGEGRTSGGRHPVTPWGKSTKGKKTRHNKRTNVFIISTRHKAKRS